MAKYAPQMKPKTMTDVRGIKIHCPEFHQCPVCYGCRNYNSSFERCLECGKNKRQNVCDTEKHTYDKISRLIIPTNIIVNNIKKKEVHLFC